MPVLPSEPFDILFKEQLQYMNNDYKKKYYLGKLWHRNKEEKKISNASYYEHQSNLDKGR